MPATSRASGRRPIRRDAEPNAAAPSPAPVPLVTAIAAVCLLVAVTFQIFDTDIWMHLTRARAALSLHALPRVQLWTWPMYGQPDPSSPAWGFAFLIWPFWKLGGVTGLFLWRWLVTLGVFGVAWRVARARGAQGLALPITLLACAMIYRPRSQVRPETLAALLLVLEIWILETRRRGGPDRAWWLVPIAWFWIGVHVSFWMCWLVGGCFLLGEWRERAKQPRGTPLLLVLLASVAVCLWNPLAGRTLWVPFQFLALRREPLYQGIGELRPLDWSINWQNGLPLLMLGWALLQLWRMQRGRGDLVEGLLFLWFTGWAISAQRFLTFWAVVAAIYLTSDVCEWLAAHRPRGRAASPVFRTAAAIAACLALTLLELWRAGYPMGIGIHPNSVPAAACDFMAAHGVRGRGFNYFEQGGYLTWRFWPDRSRLPFMTTSPELATPELRLEYERSLSSEPDWRSMDGRHRFDWALLRRQTQVGDHLVDYLDADTAFALVMVDDVSALFLRRSGPMVEVAAREGFLWLPAGQQKLSAVGVRLAADSVGRAEMRAELKRAIESSPRHSEAGVTLAALDIAEHRWDDAERALEDAHRIDPGLPGYAERRAAITAARGTQR